MDINEWLCFTSVDKEPERNANALKPKRTGGQGYLTAYFLHFNPTLGPWIKKAAPHYMLSATRDEDRQTDTGALASEGLVRLVPLPVEAVREQHHSMQEIRTSAHEAQGKHAGKLIWLLMSPAPLVSSNVILTCC